MRENSTSSPLGAPYSLWMIRNLLGATPVLAVSLECLSSVLTTLCRLGVSQRGPFSVPEMRRQ